MFVPYLCEQVCTHIIRRGFLNVVNLCARQCESLLISQQLVGSSRLFLLILLSRGWQRINLSCMKYLFLSTVCLCLGLCSCGSVSKMVYFQCDRQDIQLYVNDQLIGSGQGTYATEPGEKEFIYLVEKMEQRFILEIISLDYPTLFIMMCQYPKIFNFQHLK